MRFGAVVLAAGQSTRMGVPKLLLEWRGKSLLRRAVEAGIASGAGEVVVVLGGYGDRLEREVPAEMARIVHNPDFAKGQSTSLRAGVSGLSEAVEGAVCFPADQPYVTPSVIARLVETHEQTGRPVVVSEAAGIRGAPVFFARSVFPELFRIQGDQGAREFVRVHPELTHVQRFDDARLMLDVDTPEDYQALLASGQRDNILPPVGHADGP